MQSYFFLVESETGVYIDQLLFSVEPDSYKYTTYIHRLTCKIESVVVALFIFLRGREMWSLFMERYGIPLYIFFHLIFSLKAIITRFKLCYLLLTRVIRRGSSINAVREKTMGKKDKMGWGGFLDKKWWWWPSLIIFIYCCVVYVECGLDLLASWEKGKMFYSLLARCSFCFFLFRWSCFVFWKKPE